MKTLVLLLLPALASAQPASAPASAPASQAAEATPGRDTALSAHVVLKVINPAQARAALVEAAKAAGGFHTVVTDDGVTLKIPPGALGGFLRSMGDRGLVIEKSLTRNDLTEMIADLEGRLRSKQEILARLRGFFDQSNLEATLDIERTMNGLVAEVEQIKGELRVRREQARWAVVEVAFQYHKREQVIYVHSPFDWLNTVDLDRFRSEFSEED